MSSMHSWPKGMVSSEKPRRVVSADHQEQVYAFYKDDNGINATATVTVINVPKVTLQLETPADGKATVTAGTTMTLSVLVIDANTAGPLKDKQVTFSVNTATSPNATLNGTQTSVTVTTDDNGRAQVDLNTAPLVADGDNLVVVSTPEAGDQHFVITGTTGLASKLTIEGINSGDDSTEVVEGLETLRVLVTDDNGNRVANATVEWQIESGGGLLSGCAVSNGVLTCTTGNNGISAVGLRLGTVAGDIVVSAKLVKDQNGTDIGSPPEQTLTVHGIAGPAAKIVVVSPTASKLVVESVQELVVLVTDANDNPVANQTVNWSIVAPAAAPGTLSAASSVSGADGIARITFTTSYLKENNTVNASISADGTQTATLSFTGSNNKAEYVLDQLPDGTRLRFYGKPVLAGASQPKLFFMASTINCGANKDQVCPDVHLYRVFFVSTTGIPLSWFNLSGYYQEKIGATTLKVLDFKVSDDATRVSYRADTGNGIHLVHVQASTVQRRISMPDGTQSKGRDVGSFIFLNKDGTEYVFAGDVEVDGKFGLYYAKYHGTQVRLYRGSGELQPFGMNDDTQYQRCGDYLYFRGDLEKSGLIRLYRVKLLAPGSVHS